MNEKNKLILKLSVEIIKFAALVTILVFGTVGAIQLIAR